MADAWFAVCGRGDIALLTSQCLNLRWESGYVKIPLYNFVDDGVCCSSWNLAEMKSVGSNSCPTKSPTSPRNENHCGAHTSSEWSSRLCIPTVHIYEILFGLILRRVSSIFLFQSLKMVRSLEKVHCSVCL